MRTQTAYHPPHKHTPLSDDAMLDWHVGDEEDGQALPDAPTARRTPSLPWLPRVLLSVLIVAVLVVAVGGVFAWRVAVARQERLLTDAQAAVDSELAALRLGDPGLTVFDPNADRMWQARYVAYVRSVSRLTHATLIGSRVTSVELPAPDLALVMVETQVTDTVGTHTVREARAYRLADRQWQRTSVDERTWGAWQTLETPDFRLVYRQRDAETVKSAAYGLDTWYERMLDDLGAPPPAAGRVTITLDTLNPTGTTVRTGDGYRLSSPLTTLTGLDVRDEPEAVVREQLATALVQGAASSRGSVTAPPWRPMMWAILDAETRTFAKPLASQQATTRDQLRRAVAANRLIPLAALETYSGDSSLVSAEWNAFADFIIARLGPSGPSRVLHAVTTTRTWDEFTRAAFVLPPRDLETVWYDWLTETLN